MNRTSIVHLAHRAASIRRVGPLVLLLLGIGPAREAAAKPLAHEGFNYVPGQTLPTMGGGFGWAPGFWAGSSQMVDAPPTLSYPTALPSSGDALQIPAAAEADRFFGAPFNNAASDLWISFMEETAAAGSGASVVILPLSGPAIQVNKDGAGAITLNGNPAGISAGVAKVDFFLLQVAQFSGGSTVVNLYVNPTAVLGPPSATFSTTMVFQANEFHFQSEQGQWLDEIRVGTLSQDVSQAGAAGSNGLMGAQFFRISGPSATTITSFAADGTLVFSNAIPGATYAVQIASSLSGGVNWVKDHDVFATNSGPTTPVTDLELINNVALLNPALFLTDIPGGTYKMGDTLDGLTNAEPTNVTVSEFYMDRTLVDFAFWRTIYTWATNQGYGFADFDGLGKKANHPVHTVDWYDCVKWCNARSQQDGFLTPVYYTDTNFTQLYTNGEPTNIYANWAANGYRLPTEAEWEMAARGGLSELRFPLGQEISQSQANYRGDTNDYSYDLGPNGFNLIYNDGVEPYTSPVASFAPNGYGLYDMAGNVFEWCWDWYGTPYAGGTDPRGPATGSDRVLRGGSWVNYALFARCAFRQPVPPWAPGGNGFRCVRGH